MSNELTQNIHSINIVLDEKKCLSMKALIEHILIKLRSALGLPTGNADEDLAKDRAEAIMQGLVNQAEESGDEVLLKIP